MSHSHVNGDYAEKDHHNGVADMLEHANGDGKHGTMTATPAELAVIEDAHNACDVEMDEAEKNRLLRRIDLAIVPCELNQIARAIRFR